ncbi:DUF4132 domain-containing protein [Clostridium beijerinckii]|uniref:DUF4132 domain-containing protein n=1 Tax=Clostridium beijerinckii TaxID=1520 RepID=A0AAE5H521_CLOBE|nr:DUF4132 domain-containing protein [Clostridium beijerinckii]NSB14631.1 hypothetical protein [Clostridium beijerinckii]OOM34536.1 hypothetical protein CLOBE_01510 [Clostridium beijerinckii]
MYFDNEKEEIVFRYLKTIIEKNSSDKNIALAKEITENINPPYRELEKKADRLKVLLWDKSIKAIEEVFKGENYKKLELLLQEDYAELGKIIWDNASKYPYSIGYYRRSYRTKKSSHLYLNKNIEKLKELIYLKASDFSLVKYFENNKEKYNGIGVISDIIAVELDRNDNEVLEKIKEVIYSDNNTSIVTREIIRGLLMSENEEAHRILGDLLLAAKLQEGLRQVIVENLDEGSKEAFIYMLKLIIDNNLIRFSSVVRGFSVWTGLYLEAEKPKLILKCFEAVYRVLKDKEYQEECLASDDNILLYTGIWSVAFNELEDAKEVLNELLHGKVKYKKLAALQFLSQIQFETYKHKIACEMLEDEDLEVVGSALKNIFTGINAYSLIYNKNLIKPYVELGEAYYGVGLFNKLKRVLDNMPKKEITFKESLFPWISFELTKTELMDNMLLAVGMSYNDEILDILIDYKDKMSVQAREVLVKKFLKEPENLKQRNALIEACGDRGQSVREAAFKTINALELNREDYVYIEDLLKYKSGDLRKNAIKLLLKQSNEELMKSINNLINSKDENKKLAAIDIVNAIEGDTNHKPIFEESLKAVAAMEDVLQKGKLLTENIGNDQKEGKNLNNGFGLYDPSKDYEPIEIKNNNFDIQSKFCSTEEEIIKIVNTFSGLIDKNRDLEYETTRWDGNKEMIILGGSYYLQPFSTESRKLNNYPLAEEIRTAARNIGLDAWKLLELNFYMKAVHFRRYSANSKWYDEFLEMNFNYGTVKKLSKSLEKIKYYQLIKDYFILLADEIEKDEIFNISKTITEYIYTVIPKDRHTKKYSEGSYYNSGTRIKAYFSAASEINDWLYLLKNNSETDDKFKEYFNIAYNYYKASEYNVNGSLEIYDFGKALDLDIIDENEALKEIMGRPNSSQNIELLTSVHKYHRERVIKYEKLLELASKAVEVIGEIEVNRGELDTEVTLLASKVKKCYGVNIFASIILASEKDTYIRGYNFVSGDCTKKQILSHLLKCCYPKAGETAENLKKFLKGKKVTSKQLIEAAMYSPGWLDIVAEYLGYEGLKSACWYFHAHVNDYFSDEKTAIVARYTPITVEDLKDGAFDQEWFKEAYETLGEKNFKVVYDSAKYIAGGALHKRSQLFADATLGKLDLEEVKNRVKDKRNKDYLLTYGLIPVKNKEDVLDRYEYIQEFIKESKKFGAQRQSSERRSGSIALLNLARNAGFSDINRLIWNMETLKIQSVLAYLEPKAIEEVEVQLVIDEFGQADVVCIKAGKALKSIPAKLKKNEYILEINQLKKDLKDQYARARKSFEDAMENGEIFKGVELIELCKNPVLAPIIKSLVFKTNAFIGYLQENSLINYKNEVFKLKEDDDIIIAHPLHLYEAKVWRDYQKDIFEKKIVQPFKQVFRELYLPNKDELKEQTLSRRYAGHQVQPKKTLALLKTRGWMASDEEGLQKVYYKENIIATIYALADWFSPADIESPTIEFVRFEDRKTYKLLNLEEVSKLIFSEVMRDLDLVVSVAHVGGVDPEASMSTIEVRTAIVEEILKLMKLSNVKLKGTHAHISGVYGEYTVHLGSGIVHKMGSGAINIIPIHSGQRGKLFLPFIDSDPKSAEIISKIAILAEDSKIKDPSILEQVV